MYSPRINEKHIPVLYRRAKDKGIPMTRLVNEILEDNLYDKFHCHSCHKEVEAEKGSHTAYCESCECEVFIKEAV
jgi:DNA-directed RNA polymerase subunit RPC12/RpoP